MKCEMQWDDEDYIRLVRKMVRDLLLFAGFTNPGTFIGPPRLERETRIRESPVRVPTGTTTGPRE
jgi:hypothetical protein